MENALDCTGFVPASSADRADLDDLDQLVRLYQARIFRYAMFALKNRDLADSVTQDCFLRAYRSREKYRGECAVATWLLTIATNLIRDELRKRRFQFWRSAELCPIELPATANRLTEGSPSAERQLLARERLGKVSKLIDALPSKQRAVFHLRFVEEMDLREISVATGLNSSTVKSHLHRALAAIRAGMRQEESSEVQR